MTQFGLPFDGVGIGDASVAPYSATEWAHQWSLRHGVGSIFPNYGIFKGTGNGTYEALAVQATSPVSTNVEVQIGAALVNGRLYENTAAVTLAVGANASGNARIDTVILRLDFVAQTIRLILKQGTPAASPVRPTLQQDATYWEVPLADVAVANGFSTLAQSTITQRQRAVHSSVFGWQPYALPLNFVPQGNYDLATDAIAQSGGVWAVPLIVTGNMLVDNLTMRYVGGNFTYDLTWGIYVQDTNDGNSSENTLRLVSPVTNNTGFIATTGNLTLTASPVPFVLTPGFYWIAIRNNSAAGAMPFGIIDSSTFNPGGYQFHTTALTLGQTVNFVTGWSKDSSSPGLMLKGRVFGQTTVF